MKSRDLQWYDLFEMRGTRRDFVRLSGSVAGLFALGSIPGCSGDSGLARVASYQFTLGVASGDPAEDGVVLWTRLAREALEGVGAHEQPVLVEYELSSDEAFGDIVRTGSAMATPELGHSINMEVEGLAPSREYFYRMIVGGEVSPVGRTKTAPGRASSPGRIDFAFTSCQHYETGHFTALEHLSREDLDFIVFLGDYIYEYAEHDRDTIRHHTGPEIVTLEHYRNRYSQYRSDPALQAAHAAAPWIVTTDDHEVDNNWADEAAQDDQSPEQLLLRRAAAFQAYYEFMPLRRTAMPRGPDIQLYRRLRFGDLMEMSVLDTRQYRSDQPCRDGQAPSCAVHMSPEQSILGQNQKDWLFEGLSAADARWTVIAQQVMVARMRGTNDEGDETWSMDKWDGYPLERQAMLDALSASGTPNPVVLTGDIHSNWVTDLKLDFDDPSSATVASEFVCTSLSSGGDGQDMTGRGAASLAANEHIKFYNSQRGYVTATVTPQLWTSEYKIVPFVTRPGAPLETRATFVVEDGRPGAEEA
jgi:alkaline phosphatase D